MWRDFSFICQPTLVNSRYSFTTRGSPNLFRETDQMPLPPRSPPASFFSTQAASSVSDVARFFLVPPIGRTSVSSSAGPMRVCFLPPIFSLARLGASSLDCSPALDLSLPARSDFLPAPSPTSWGSGALSGPAPSASATTFHGRSPALASARPCSFFSGAHVPRACLSLLLSPALLRQATTYFGRGPSPATWFTGVHS